MDFISLIGEISKIKLLSISENTITVGDLFVLVIILVGTFLVSRWVRKVVRAALDRSGFKDEAANPILKLIHYFIVVIGIYIGFNSIGVPLTGVLAAAGVAGIIIGFGLQSITSNMISGLILMGDRTVRIGDIVEFDNKLGKVTDTGVRSTTVKTIDNLHIIVPNQELFSKPFVNYSYKDEKIRISTSVGVKYGTNVEKVKEILLEIARDNDTVLNYPEPEVFFSEFGDSALQFKLKCWILAPLKKWKVKSQLNFEVNKRLKEEGITIPFPQRDVWLKNQSEPQPEPPNQG
ncbi:MAG: Small-conductance mechanosensitive channel, MscC family [Candidatus Methanohalarchaeum thermophilum]|uniref:Small-conductance mechanosensitive channel, MscC family n=1 Tax=Methanohalarchaeum thermophilum TaxID=1903181 RepID=A0A1Q6DX35_METT1|nr:MAG: Small-conductance mechanosensitive channel, MscC family [Candidatus Methanohalarchaeum thermophilum]